LEEFFAMAGEDENVQLQAVKDAKRLMNLVRPMGSVGAPAV
jgi:hypothetical protein